MIIAATHTTRVAAMYNLIPINKREINVHCMAVYSQWHYDTTVLCGVVPSDIVLNDCITCRLTNCLQHQRDVTHISRHNLSGACYKIRALVTTRYHNLP